MFESIKNTINYVKSTSNRCHLNVFDQSDIFCSEHQCMNCRQHVKYQTLIITIVSLAVLTYYVNAIYASKLKEEDDSALVPPNPQQSFPPSKSTLRVFENSAVCSDAAICSKIGNDILKKNGSAIDAAISAMICNGVINMHSMGLGGGFLMTIFKKKSNQVYSVNAREVAPAKATDSMFRNSTATEGPLSMGVPGQIKGFHAIYERFGKLPWKDLVEPSIELCEQGYKMSRHQYLSLQFRKNLTHDYNLKNWFYDSNGEFKLPNSIIIPRELCETLKILAENGPMDFYNGNLSKLFLQDIKEVGGIVTAEDLNSYEVEWQEPFSIPLRNGDWFYSSPPPGSGAIAGFILNTLEGYNFTKESINGIENTITTYHRILEVFKYAYAKRTELGDPNFVNMRRVLKELSSKEYSEYIRSKIKDHRTYSKPLYYGGKFFSKFDQGTAHLGVISSNGDAVSVTSTVNIFFGAGITSKRTGIVFNSIMDDFSFPWIINFFGLTGSPYNKMEPGKRPLSSMTPTIIVDKNNDVKIVVGAAGGSQITTSVALSLMRVLWFNDSVKEALDAPRIHHQLAPMVAQYEYGTLQQVVTGLKRLGHNMKRGIGSVVCMLQREGNRILGNADYRKGGDVFGT